MGLFDRLFGKKEKVEEQQEEVLFPSVSDAGDERDEERDLPQEDLQAAPSILSEDQNLVSEEFEEAASLEPATSMTPEVEEEKIALPSQAPVLTAEKASQEEASTEEGGSQEASSEEPPASPSLTAEQEAQAERSRRLMEEYAAARKAAIEQLEKEKAAAPQEESTKVLHAEEDEAVFPLEHTPDSQSLEEEIAPASEAEEASGALEEGPSPETDAQKYERSLEKTRKGFGARLNEFFANFRRVDEEFFEELEELLILSDVGVQVASTLTEDLRYEAKLQNAKKPADLRAVILEKLVDIYDRDGVYKEDINLQEGLTVMLFVGVNGVGKTTSIGKLAHRYKQEGKRVMLVAADTFRAGAVAQLEEWGRRVDVPVVTGPEKSDPASVVYDGMERAVAEGVDILLIDTAGRLQNKDHLMAELEKIGRIIKRVVPDAPHETLLAVDASTGQNALVQAKEFSKITPLTGLVLTKIDGTARGGVVLAIRQELEIPVKFIGFGEKIDDIGPFRSEDFMRGLLEGLL